MKAAQRKTEGAKGKRRENCCGRNREGKGAGAGQGHSARLCGAAQVAQKKAKIILTLIFLLFFSLHKLIFSPFFVLIFFTFHFDFAFLVTLPTLGQ